MRKQAVQTNPTKLILPISAILIDYIVRHD